MGRKNRQKDNYWDSEFEQDLEAIAESSEEPKSGHKKTEEKLENKTSVKEKQTETHNGSTPSEPPIGGGGGATTLGGAPVQLSAAKKKKNKKKEKEKQQKAAAQQQEVKEVKVEKEEGEKVSAQQQQEKEKEGEQGVSEGKKEGTTEEGGGGGESDVGTEGDEGQKGDAKKKKKKKGKGKETEKKPPGAAKAFLLEQIKKRKEEEERLRLEEERKQKEAEEAEKRRQEEEARQEAIRLKQKEKKREKNREKRKQQAESGKAKKYAQIREQFKAQGVIPTTTEQKHPVYGKKKKPKQQQQQQQQDEVVTSSPEESKAVVAEEEKSPKEEPSQEPQEEKKPEPEEEEEEEETWEDKDVEDFEVKDSWDESDEEKESTEPKKKEQPKKVQPKKVEPKKEKVEKKEVPSKTQATQPSSEEQTPSTESTENTLRSPICCVLGHVDTGKTKILDKIRRTNVQGGEAGGITQQIGATFFPMEALQEQMSKLETTKLSVKVPGLLIIDTPGHESFTNLRSRGSGLCDIAVLVVDIMHGLEPQTVESLNLLKMRKTPFVVALNKIDRLFDWKTVPNAPLKKALAKQDKTVKLEYENRVKEIILQFAEKGMNAVLYYQNKDFRKFVSLVPTSAISGEGIPDLLMLLVQLTQKMMSDRLLYLDKLQCTVLEVKVVEGLGTTIDVILVNGVLHEGDTIVVCGLDGPIVTSIRALLTPHPLKEIRVKGQYMHHKEIQAAQGIKISAQNLDRAVAGSSLLVAGPSDDIEDLKVEVMKDLESMRQRVETSGQGVYVQASTLGSLEALLEFLKDSKIPVSAINIGPVNKRDVVKASVMLEHAKEYAVILAFDVKVTKDASELAEELGVTIFTADIIYHLFDSFSAYMEKIETQKKLDASIDVVFPARLKIIPEYIFNKRDPIILGVEVLEGTLRMGTPIAVASKEKEFAVLGKVTSIENNHKAVEEAKQGLSVAVKIEQLPGTQVKTFGRHFDHNDELVSRITRKSIDIIKNNFANEVTKEDVQLLAKLKALFGIK